MSYITSWTQNHPENKYRYYEIKKTRKKNKWPNRKQLSHWYLLVQCYQMHVSGSSCAAAINIRSGAVCLHKFMWWFWPPWRKKKNPLCVCYFSEQAKSVPSNSFPIPSLTLSPPSPPDYLSSHFFNLILSPGSSSAVPGDEMVHLSGFLSHDWEQQTRFFTCLPFS